VTVPRRTRRTGQVECTREKKGAYRVLVGKPEEKRKLGRPMHMGGRIILKLRIKNCLEKRVLDWIDLTQDTDWLRDFVEVVMNFMVSQNTGI
jgi:hypothetical protein